MADNINIKNVTEAEEVRGGDFFIIETPEGTRSVDFSNILIPLDNATFNNKISAFETDINTHRSEIIALTASLNEGSNTDIKVRSVSAQTLTADSITTDSITTDSITTDSLSIGGDGSEILTPFVQVVCHEWEDTSTYSLPSDTVTTLSAASGRITSRYSNSSFLLLPQISGEVNNDSGGALRRIVDGVTTYINVSAGYDSNRKRYMFQASYDADNNSTPVTELRMHIDQPFAPAGTEIKYYMTWEADSTNTFYLNRAVSDSNSSNYERGHSKFTIVEIASGAVSFV